MTPDGTGLLRRLLPDSFVIALLITVALATFLPVSGAGATFVGWLATAAVVLLFFFHGAKLSRQAILDGMRHWRLHLTILGSTFVMFPLVTLALKALAPDLLPPPLWLGMLYLAALPSTVQSSIAFTSVARGNVPAAIAAASASQVLGVFATPFLVGILAGAHGDSSGIANIGPVILQILVPFICGHMLRPLIGDWVQRHRAAISITDRGTILLAIYSAFSAAVIEGLWSRLPAHDFALLLGLCGVLLAIALLFTHRAAKLAGFNREDSITILFCGTKKSLVQGVPMARVLFAGPDLGLILMPIMIFHQIQLMACAWIAGRYAKGAPDV